jgi:hypothetical protein
LRTANPLTPAINLTASGRRAAPDRSRRKNATTLLPMNRLIKYDRLTGHVNNKSPRIDQIAVFAVSHGEMTPSPLGRGARPSDLAQRREKAG